MDIETKLPSERLPTTPEELLRWEGGGDFRWELVNGEAIRLPRDGTERHMRVAIELATGIHAQLDPARWLTGLFLLCVLTPAGVRMPDLVVDANIGRGDEMAAHSPVFVAEITSDWSRDRDLGSKRQDYLGIPSLRHYLVLAQETCCVWLWSRSEDAWEGPTIITDREAEISLPTLGATLKLAAIYEHVEHEVFSGKATG